MMDNEEEIMDITNVNNAIASASKIDSVAGSDVQNVADDDPVDEDSDGEHYIDSDDDNEEDEAKPETMDQTTAEAVFGDFSFAADGPKNSENEECINMLAAEAERWVSQDTCSTARVNTEKHFICLKYPAIIRNKEKAMATLGGFEQINEARKVGKLDLVFRPEDPYCKPAVGLYSKNNHLLVKCRRRKVKDTLPSTSAGSNEMNDGYEYKVEVLGIIDGIFRFNTPCDYQYLPVTKKDGGEGYQELLSSIMVKFDDERQSYLNRNVPLFLPPYVFSRSEKPAKYVFQNDQHKDTFIGLSRKMRPMGTQRMVFTSRDVPTKPNKDAMSHYELQNLSLDPLKKLFEERPLWSKTGIVSRLRATNQMHLKIFVNMVAYYFGSGPWIHLWCRFGYDPRKDPTAKIYQTVDFRIRKAWFREKVTAKRGTDHFLSQRRQGLNTIKGHRLPSMAQLSDETSTPSTSKEGDDQEIDLQCQYVPDRMPPYRQMYYQVCDVFEDQIQALAHKNDGQETECTEKDGWCVPDFLPLCRDILTEHAQNLFTMQQPVTEKQTLDDT